jgi:uncharacterized lipoprotein YddW (UPF0748 family)
MRLIFIILLLPTVLFSQVNPKSRHAFWVVRDAILNEAEIDEIIHTAASLNISDIFVQVRALGRTYYESSHESSIKIVGKNFDPLHVAIKKARLYDIRIHAWINMFYIWSGVNEPKENSHVFHLCKRNILRNGNFPSYHELKAKGIEGYFLDPQSQQVKKYLLNLLQEVADKYEVAGIHLDYFRYPGVFYSFTPENRTSFLLKNYYDPLEVYNSVNEYVQKRGHEVFRYADREYRKFLVTSLSDYLMEIKKILKGKKQNIELSVAVKPDPVVAKHRYFQDWYSWIKLNLCDFVVIMNYRTEWKEFMLVLNQIENIKIRERVMVGISTYNQDVQAVKERILVVENSGFAGLSLFSYNHLIKYRNYLKKIGPIFRTGGSDGS